jgi:hypothetical protein
VTIAFERALSEHFLQERYIGHHDVIDIDIMMPYDIASTHADYTFARRRRGPTAEQRSSPIWRFFQAGCESLPAIGIDGFEAACPETVPREAVESGSASV